MSNLLSIPSKKTYSIDVREAARNHIYARGGGHPDEFKDDIALWQNLRKGAVGDVVHVDRINALLLYHAQLVSILTKLPVDIGLAIAYAPAFQPNVVPVTLNNLVFERCGILFNIASLYSQLAVAEDRSKLEGIKRATANHQYAAGVLSFLASSALPKLILSPDEENIPRDLSRQFIKSLEWLMLAQAQECSWQLAKLNQYKNGLIAKIAARASALYQSAIQAVHDASPPIRDLFPSDWLPHIEAKAYHFAAVAQYRKSMDEIETSRYGTEIARLSEAQTDAKKAFDIARRGRVVTSVIQDIQSLLDIIQSHLTRAQRDNDLIYHHDVPARSALMSITQTNLVTPMVPRDLSDPVKLLGNSRVIFGGLVSWGATEAINIYHDRKENLIKDKIVDVSGRLRRTADEALQLLNLPSALEALERPIELPPSLLRKASEVREEDGPTRIEKFIDDVKRLARQDVAILNEAMDMLDNEASEDEAARKHAKLDRTPSHEANVELVEKEKRYRAIIAQAATSDGSVREKWEEWESNIRELTWSEEDLEAAVPSSTLSSAAPMTPQGKQTQAHARALRIQMEELDDLHRTREQIVRRAQKRAAADDIRNRILQAATGFERFVEVEPAAFEDVLDEELAKYDRFLSEMDDVEKRQNGVLAEIQHRNELFLQSRRDDPVIKEREHALQSLDLAYHKYREVIRNLDEGLKFYNDLAAILLQFKEACKTWSHFRNQQIRALTRSFQTMSIHDGPNTNSNQQPDVSTNPSRPPVPPNIMSSPASLPKSSGKKSSGLPPLTSSEWGFEEIQLPPPPKKK